MAAAAAGSLMEVPTLPPAQVTDDGPQTRCAATGCLAKFVSDGYSQYMSHDPARLKGQPHLVSDPVQVVSGPQG